MTYYRVLPKYDNKRYNSSDFVIANELYTEKEMEKYGIPYKYTEKINHSKKRVYFFFGARFEY